LHGAFFPSRDDPGFFEIIDEVGDRSHKLAVVVSVGCDSYEQVSNCTAVTEVLMIDEQCVIYSGVAPINVNRRTQVGMGTIVVGIRNAVSVTVGWSLVHAHVLQLGVVPEFDFVDSVQRPDDKDR
jgi:hypothetical protein